MLWLHLRLGLLVLRMLLDLLSHRTELILGDPPLLIHLIVLVIHLLVVCARLHHLLRRWIRCGHRSCLLLLLLVLVDELLGLLQRHPAGEQLCNNRVDPGHLPHRCLTGGDSPVPIRLCVQWRLWGRLLWRVRVPVRDPALPFIHHLIALSGGLRNWRERGSPFGIQRSSIWRRRAGIGGRRFIH